jgi:hypothetical protein
MTNDGFRAPTPHERELIGTLTQKEFEGVTEIRIQLASCEVRPIDAEGSLELRVKESRKAKVRFRVPVELAGRDTDGFGIHVLLHVVDGICKEIEVYKDTSDAILSWPASWEILISGPEK